MPLDQQGFQIEPITRTDEVLNVLVKARADIARCWYAGARRAELSVGNGNCTTNSVYLLTDYAMGSRLEALQLLATAHGVRGFGDIWHWNDTVATHADVLALFDRAIAKRVADAKAAS